MSRSPIPDISDDQRRDALAKATQVRRERAAIKAKVRSGEMRVSEVLEMEGDAAQKMRVFQLVCSVPGGGKKRAEKLLDRLKISAARRVRGLGHNQREALVKALG